MNPARPIRIAGFSGDGIGPEIYRCAEDVFGAANNRLGFKAFDMTRLPYDANYYLEKGRPWPNGTAASLMRRFDAGFVTAFGDPRVPQSGMAHARSILLDGLRGRWRTNLNWRPCELVHPNLRPVIKTVQRPFELFALDERAEPINERVVANSLGDDIFVDETHKLVDYRKNLVEAARRAKDLGQSSLIVVHKENVFRFGHGLWSRVEADVATETGVKIERQLMDSFLERLVKAPETVPLVIVTDRFFGSVLSRALKPFQDGTERQPIPDDFRLFFGRENTEGMYFRRGKIKGEGLDAVGIQTGRHSREMVGLNLRATRDQAGRVGLSDLGYLHVGDVHPQAYAVWADFAGQGEDAIRPMHAGDFVAQLITDPKLLSGKVLAADNILGDICGDAAAALVGGLGIAATICFNTDGKTRMIYAEPLHGSAPDKAGKDTANPTATYLTLAQLFKAYDFAMFDETIRGALFALIDRGLRTGDMPGTSVPLGTMAFHQAFMTQAFEGQPFGP